MEKTATRNGADTAAVIQQTAIRLMQAKGFDGTSIRDIARESGVGIATVFHHFGSKSELLERTLKSEFDYLLEQLHGAIDHLDDPVDRLSETVRVHVLLHCIKPESTIVHTELRSLDPVPRAEVQVRAEQVHEMFAEAVVSGTQSGAFDCERPRETALAIHSMCSGVASWYRPGVGRPPEDIANDYVGFALRLVAAEPPPGAKRTPTRARKAAATRAHPR